jgi:hypothetical protein
MGGRRNLADAGLSGRLATTGAKAPTRDEGVSALAVTTGLPAPAGSNELPLADRPWVDHLAVVGFLLAAVVGGGLLLHLGRELTFFYDEWDWIFHRRSGGAESFLGNHNGHLHLLPIAAYRVLFVAVGLGTYLPYRIAVIVVHVACAGAVFVYCRRRVAPPAALSVSVVVLFLGAAWQNLLWPFQIGFLGSVFFGLLALLVIDDQPGRRDWLAALFLLLGIASSGIGVPVLLAVGAELTVQRAWRRLARVVGPPAVVYSLWTLGYGASQAERANFSKTPRYVFDAAAGAAAGLGNLSQSTGRVLVVGLALAIFASLVAYRRLPPRVVVLLVAAGSYWGLTALSRAHAGEPAASRYVYFGGVVLLLLVVELVQRWRAGTALNAVAVVVAVVFAWSNLSILRAGAAGLRDNSSFVRAELLAVELAGSRVPANFRPDEQRMPQVTVGEYLAAVRALGSPAGSVADLRARSTAARASADEVLIRSLDRVAEPSSNCQPMQHAGELELSVPSDGVVIMAKTAAVAVGLRRFGSEFIGTEPVPSGQSVRLLFTRDDAPDPWLVRLTSNASFEVCTPNG